MLYMFLCKVSSHKCKLSLEFITQTDVHVVGFFLNLEMNLIHPCSTLGYELQQFTPAYLCFPSD